MASGHLVTHSNLALLGYIHLCKLHYSVGELIAYLKLVHFSFTNSRLCL